MGIYRWYFNKLMGIPFKRLLKMECRDQVTHVEDFNLPSGDLLQFAMDNGH